MKQVMIVEDQKMIRSLLESYIEKEPGYQVAVSIPGANQAPGLCDTMGIDLILMDVQTEHRENGLAAVERSRRATRIFRLWWSHLCWTMRCSPGRKPPGPTVSGIRTAPRKP